MIFEVIYISDYIIVIIIVIISYD